MVNCVNKNSKFFKDLRRETNLSERLLATKISLWQKKNGLDKFPTQENIFSTMSIANRIGISSKKVSGLEKSLINGRVRIYNTLKNIQRIFVDFTKEGQADLHTWVIRNLDAPQEPNTQEIKKNTGEQQSLFFQINNKELKKNEVNYALKSVDILQSDKAKQIFEKGEKNNWDLDKILSELQIPKEQKKLLLSLNIKNSNVLNSKQELGKIANSNSRLNNIAKLLFNKSSNLNRIVNTKLESGGTTFTDFNKKTQIVNDVAIDENNIALVVKNRPDLKDFRDEVIIHEEIHRYTKALLTYSSLADNSNVSLSDIGFTNSEENFVKEIKELYKQYLNTNNTNFDFNQPNNDLNEFLTYGLTNSSFIKELSNIKIENSSILNKLINILKNLFKEISIKNALDISFENFIKSNNTIDEISSSTEYFTPTPFNLREQLAIELAANYSYSVEINTSKTNDTLTSHDESAGVSAFEKEGKYYMSDPSQDSADEISKDEYDKWIKDSNTFLNKNSDYYSNLTVPGGTNYTEQEISIPLITPSIKGHAQFSTDNGIGWFRSDDKSDNSQSPYKDEPPYGDSLTPSKIKIRRILEVQSDLFQKGRDKEDLTKVETNKLVSEEEYNNYVGSEDDAPSYEKYLKNHKSEILKEDIKGNQFLQLLNKDNNWVTFFIKSLIQDSVKKGYEKVLFPTGNTASKIEGHSTLEEFKKQKEDRIKQLKQKDIDSKDLIDYNKEKIIEYSIGLKIKDNGMYYIETSNGFANYGKNYEDAFISFQNDLEQLKQDVINAEKDIKQSSIEINQLNQELKQVEGPQGFGALKPIYNFYENTLTNILKKQGYNAVVITDEYGNTWNEVAIEAQRDAKTISLKKTELNQSVASKETLDKLKAIINKLGINLVTLEKYLKGNPEINARGIDGLADLVKGVIAIATGRESEALTEEMVHVVTAIIEQTNPQLITSLISKISRFKIYNLTLKLYEKDKNYQLADGKPDIRKIKKEAVDKLIAEYIINQSEGSEQFPELTQLENRTLIQEMWDAITSFIRQLYSKGQVNMFEELAKDILEGNIKGSVNDLNSSGENVMFKIRDSLVEKTASVFRDMNNDTELVDATDLEQRHYTYKGKKLKYTVSTINGVKSLNITDPQKIADNEMKKQWGSEGHMYIEKYIAANLIDENGYKLETSKDIVITSPLNEKTRTSIEVFCNELINSYAEGTVFLLESKVVNEKTTKAGGMGSAIDFIAIEPIDVPVKNAKGEETGEVKKDVKVDILDWKFSTSLNKDNEDIIVSKQNDWKKQMGEYSKIMYNLGIKREQLRKTRMLPFISNYDYAIANVKSSGLKLTSIEIGKLDSLTETNLYLLPVSLISETTGNETVDTLVQSLNKFYQKLILSDVNADKKYIKEQRLKELSTAIKTLHLKLNFEPLYNIAKSFLIDVKESLQDFKSVDFTTLNQEQLGNKLRILVEYQRSAEKFIDLETVYLSHISKDDMTPENKKLLNDFKRISESTKIALEQIAFIQQEYARADALKLNITNINDEQDLLQAEKEINGLDKNFLEFSKLGPVIIRLVAKKWLLAKSMIAITFSEKATKYGKSLNFLQQEAKSRGKSAFEMIGEVTSEGLRLFSKVDKKFIDGLEKARTNFDKKTLLKNIDLAKYKKLIESYIIASLKNIENTQYSANEEENQISKDKRKQSFLNSIDISSKMFNGYDNKAFIKYYNQSIIEEGNYSKEYQEILKSENALEVWKFFTELNNRAIKAGYIDKQGSSFFPLIEATLLQKIGNGNNIFSEAKDLFKDIYTVDSNETISYSKTDSETGEVRQNIPKYFTTSKKQTNQLSTDLNKVGLMWLEAVMDYESRKELEFQMLTLAEVEKSKKTLITDSKGNIVFKGNIPQTKDQNNNAEFLSSSVEGLVYGANENMDSLGNALLTSTFNKEGDEENSEERATSVKKALKGGETYLRLLALGLNSLVGIANFVGNSMQAFINSGSHYTEKDFGKYLLKIMTPFTGLSLIEKALIDTIVPLSGEDPLVIKQREIAKGESYASYLNAWTFQDVMMVTNSFGEKRIELSNAAAIIANSIIINGKIINIRQYLKNQDRANRSTLSEQERNSLERSFESRVKELKESDKALVKIAKFENDSLSIPNVSVEELALFRMSIIDVARNANGQMSHDDQMGFRRDTLFNSFMMFKGWIPKLISVRYKNITLNTATNDWEYGRYKAFWTTLSSLGFKNITDLRDVITGSDKGLKIINEILQRKKDQYFRQTGKALLITPEEFQDLMRSQITNMFKELYLIVGLVSLLIAAKLAAPDDDDDDLSKNRYKYVAKAINKISDELLFFVNPTSADSVTKGSILPALGLFSKIENLFRALGKETYYTLTDDQKAADRVYPTKYLINLFPVVSQGFNQLLPYVNPELYKQMGGRVTINVKQ